MIRVEIGLRDGLMTATTLIHDRELESLVVRPANRVCTVTVAARRQLFLRLRDKRRVNTLFILLFDTVMALAASLRDVLVIYRTERVLAWQSAVCRMAVRAHCRDDEAALQQSLTVDALCIMVRDVVFRALITDSGFLTFAMTFCAERRNPRWKCHRLRIRPLSNHMRAVTFRARRCVCIVPGEQRAVNALLVHLDLLGMTTRAIDFRGDRFAWTFLRDVDATVALAAPRIRMRRFSHVVG